MRNETAKRLAYWRELLDSIRSELTPKSAKRKFESLSRQRTPYLDKAANYFDLKVSRRTDAAILVRILASVIFDSREKNRPAGSKKWDEVRLFQLFIHHKLIEREKPSISDSRAAEEIKNRFPGHYQRDEPATIRQRILAARALANKRRFLDDWFLLALKQLTEGIEDKPGSQSAQQFRASADRCLKVMEGFYWPEFAASAKPRHAAVLAATDGLLSATRNAAELEAWLREDSVGELIKRFKS
jgi:hypothetical protein